MKAEYSQVLYLVYFEELSHADISEIMGKNEKQVRDLIYNAKKALKAELERRGTNGQI